MTEGFPYIDLILLAGIALFIALRLRSVLGKKIGFDGSPAAEKLPADPLQARQRAPEDVEKDKQKLEAAESALLSGLEDTTVKTGLEALRQKFPDFSAITFIEGAKIAFDMVFESFAKGDKTSLKMLLTEALQPQFFKEIDAREKADQKAENTLVSIESAEISQVRLTQEAFVEITVKFISEQIHVVRDKEGKIIEGDPSQVVQVEDEWTFKRDMRSRDPNWKITAL